MTNAIAYTAVAGDSLAERTDIKCFGDVGIFRRSVMEAKRYKILPHLFLDDDVTVWIDGNISLRAPVEDIAIELLGDADFALFCHPYSKTVWDEFKTLQNDPRFDIDYLQRQLAEQRRHYADSGLPLDTPAYECNFMIRRNIETVHRLMEAWWAQICRWQWRDQVSLPFVLWKYGRAVKMRVTTGVNIRDHRLFEYVSQY